MRRKRHAAQKALIAELTAQGFFGPPNLQLAGFQREISRFESLFLGFGLQTAFAMLTDNERIAKQERERYWGAEAATLLRIIAAKLDKFDKVAIATTWTGVVPGSLRSDQTRHGRCEVTLARARAARAVRAAQRR